MATTLYLPSSSAAPAISPAASSGWTAGTPDYLIMGKAKTNTSMVDKTVSLPTGSAKTIYRTYVFGPLQAATIAANVVWTAYARGSEANANLNAFPAIGIWVATPAGALRGTVRAGASTGSGSELALSLTSRQFHLASYTSSSVAITAGDYLVVEFGIFQNSGITTGNTILNFGDNAASDLADNITTTANNPVFTIATDLFLLEPAASFAFFL